MVNRHLAAETPQAPHVSSTQHLAPQRMCALAACSLALAVGAALVPGSARRQHATGVALMAVARVVAAVWPAALGGGFVAFCTWLAKVAYGCCTILRSTWDPSTVTVMDFWIAPVSKAVPWSSMLAVGACIDWAVLRRHVPWPVLVPMIMATGFFAAYPSWLKHCRQQQTGCSYLYHAVPAMFLSAAVPAVCIELLPKLVSAVLPATKPVTSNTVANATPSTGCKAHKQLVQQPCKQDTAHSSASQHLQAVKRRMPQYQPPLGEPVPLCLKIHGSLQPADMPDDMTEQLAVCLQPWYNSLNAAVRAGCVCISLDLSEGGLGQLGVHGFSTEVLAQVLLPAIKEFIAAAKTESKLTEVPPLTIQLGQQQLTAQWDAGTSSWQIQLVEPSLIDAVDVPRLSLGCVQQCHHGIAESIADGLSQPQPTGPSCTTGTASCSAAGVLQPTDSERSNISWRSEGSHMHVLHAQAQLVVSEGSTPLTTAQLAAVTGWEAPAAQGPDHHEHVPVDKLRLLACCAGSYVSSHVMEVIETSAHQQHPVVKVELYVPDDLAPKHHIGGPPVGLLPVVFELWQGEKQLGTAWLLMVLDNKDGAAADSPPQPSCGVTRSSGCWWWGTAEDTMQQVAQELHAQATGLARDSQVPLQQDLEHILPDSGHAADSSTAARMFTTQTSQTQSVSDSAQSLQGLTPVETPDSAMATPQMQHMAGEGAFGSPLAVHQSTEATQSGFVSNNNSYMGVIGYWHAFMRDLVVWLEEVKRAATASKMCMAAATDRKRGKVPQPRLGTDKLLALYKALLEFSEDLGMQHTVEMLKQQQVVLHAWTQQKQQAKPQPVLLQQQQAVTVTTVRHASQGSSGILGVTWCDVRAALLGSHCVQCEVKCRQDLAHWLAALQSSSIQLLMSAAMATSGLIRAGVVAYTDGFTQAALIGGWAVLRLLIFLQQLIAVTCSSSSSDGKKGTGQQPGRPRNKWVALSSTSNQWWLLTCAYLERQVSHLMFVSGLLEVNVRMKPATVVVNYLVLTMVEQVQVSMLLSRGVAGIMVACDLTIYMLLSAMMGSPGLYLLLFLVPIATLPRLVSETLIRARLRTGAVKAVHQQAQLKSPSKGVGEAAGSGVPGARHAKLE